MGYDLKRFIRKPILTDSICSIVTPLKPNGVSYLLNILLELGLPIYRCINPMQGLCRMTWKPRSDGSFIVRHNEYNRLKDLLPSLSNNQYRFNDNVSFHWDHPYSSTFYRDVKSIILTRDPRDSLYSWYRRVSSNMVTTKIGFEDHLESKSIFFDKLWPEVKSIIAREECLFPSFWASNIDSILSRKYGTPIDELMASYEICFRIGYLKYKGLEQVPCLISFESLKNNPLPSVQKILQLVNISRSDDQILKAVEMSSVQRALTAQKNSTNTLKNSITINKGLPSEFKHNISHSSSYERIRTSTYELFDLLGYE